MAHFVSFYPKLWITRDEGSNPCAARGHFARSDLLGVLEVLSVRLLVLGAGLTVLFALLGNAARVVGGGGACFHLRTNDAHLRDRCALVLSAAVDDDDDDDSEDDGDHDDDHDPHDNIAAVLLGVAILGSEGGLLDRAEGVFFV